MDTTNTSAKQGLFSTLARHEVGQSEVNTIESSRGLRPRLPNRFEALDANMDTPPFEEQQSETSISSSANAGFSAARSEAVGLPAVKSSFTQENLLQPEDRFQYLPPSQAPAHFLGQPNDRTPEAGPQSARIWTSDHKEKFSAEAKAFTPPTPNSLQPSRAIELPHEKSITEKLTTVERETIREIHSSKTSMPQPGLQPGSIPRIQPVQRLMSPAVEKASQPNIEIHIGRIEVRAHIQATQPKLEKISASATNDGSLQLYLRGRSRGARS